MQLAVRTINKNVNSLEGKGIEMNMSPSGVSLIYILNYSNELQINAFLILENFEYQMFEKPELILEWI
jgi:hypothetical protein